MMFKNRDNKDRFEKSLSRAFIAKGKDGNVKGEIVGVWWEYFEDWTIEEFEAAIKIAVESSEYNLQPASIIKLMPSKLGYRSTEQAYAERIQGDHDANWLTTIEIAAADAAERADKYSHKKAFVERYEQLLQHARTNKIRAAYLYSNSETGDYESRKSLKARKTTRAIESGVAISGEYCDKAKIEYKEHAINNTGTKRLASGVIKKDETSKKERGQKVLAELIKKVEFKVKKIERISVAESMKRSPVMPGSFGGARGQGITKQPN